MWNCTVKHHTGVGLTASFPLISPLTTVLKASCLMSSGSFTVQEAFISLSLIHPGVSDLSLRAERTVTICGSNEGLYAFAHISSSAWNAHFPYFLKNSCLA